ncbi:MAG: hypothetical protein V1793_18590 [Pseudomonadota bacterium]
MESPNKRWGKSVQLATALVLSVLLIGPMVLRYVTDPVSGVQTGSADLAYAADEKAPAKGVPAAPAAKDAAKGADPAPEKNDAARDPAPCPECPDPAKVVLNGLEEKRKTLARAEDQLKQEKKQLEKFKEEIDEKLEKLEGLKKQIASDLALFDQKKSAHELAKEAEFEAKLAKLVKVYAGMKPKEAGDIINKMDIEVTRQILSRMREASAAQILAFVNPERAAKISEGIVYPR